MSKKIVILGAGFGGLEAATLLSGKLDDRYEITMIDKNDSFFIGFSKFDVLFGRKSEQEIKYNYKDIKAERVNFVKSTIYEIDIDNKTVHIPGKSFSYDYLIVALGADLNHGAIPGFVESGGYEFYSLEGAKKLNSAINAFERGTVLINIFSKPYKCPPAPYEGAFLLHDFFEQKGVREQVTIKMIIPAGMPLPVSKEVSGEIENLLAERNIELVKSTKITKIDAANKKAVAEDGAQFEFDLFVGVPVHTPPKVVKESKLGGDQGFVLASKENLATRFEGVYAIGDVAKVPVGEAAVPKAGVFAEDAARTVVADILLKEGVDVSPQKFNATGACYFEFGGGRVAKVNVNFLGEEKPKAFLEGLSSDLRTDKQNFQISRKKRWFK
ncbi:MAG: FAD-dependent oxidoreductase [Anditalea sp.]